MIGARDNRHLWVAFGVSALVHFGLLAWIAVPKMEVPQIAGGGAAFGLDGTIGNGEAVQDAAVEAQDDSRDDEALKEEVMPLEMPPLPLAQIAPTPLPIAAKVPQAPLPRSNTRHAQSKPPAAKPATPASKQQARPKPAPVSVPKAVSSPAPANTSSKADPSAKAGTDSGTGSATSGKGSAAKTNYSGRVLQQLERHRRSNTTGPGSVYIQLSIAMNGKLESSSVSRSSGSSRFDREALRMVKRASPFPKPPPGINRKMVVEIKGR